MPAHPVALTQASQAGTCESVNDVRNKNKMTDPPKVMASVTYHSDRVEKVTAMGALFLFVDQYHQPYTLITK